MKSTIIRQLLSICAVVVASVGTLHGQATPQGPPATPRTVNLEIFRVDQDPILPVTVRIGSELFKLPPFRLTLTADDDDQWLERAQLTIRNVTNRKIIGVWVQVEFAPTQDPYALRVMDAFTIGEVPERSQYDSRGVKHRFRQHPPLDVGPKSTFTIMLTSEYPEMKKSIDNHYSISDITSLWIRILDVYFSDGSRWGNGDYQIPDPNDPKKFLAGSAVDFRLGLKSPKSGER